MTDSLAKKPVWVKVHFFLHMSNEQNTQTKANQPPKVALMTMTTGPNVAATCEENEGAHT